MVSRFGAHKFAFWKSDFWRSGERFGATSSDEVALVVIQNKAAAEMVPISAGAEHALVEQFAQMTEHGMSCACASEVLDTRDGSVLMQQVAHVVERRLRSKMWIARLEGGHDSESEQACLLAFYSGILDMATEKEMHALGCELPRDCLQTIMQERGFLNLPWLGSSLSGEGET